MTVHDQYGGDICKTVRCKHISMITFWRWKPNRCREYKVRQQQIHTNAMSSGKINNNRHRYFYAYECVIDNRMMAMKWFQVVERRALGDVQCICESNFIEFPFNWSYFIDFHSTVLVGKKNRSKNIKRNEFDRKNIERNEFERNKFERNEFDLERTDPKSHNRWKKEMISTSRKKPMCFK